MSQLERNKKVLVGKDLTPAGTNFTDLAEGEVVIVAQDGTFADNTITAQTSPFITIAVGTADGPKLSQKITGKNITSVIKKAYEAPVRQVTYIGSNGVAGAIAPVSNETEYSLHIVFKNDKVSFSERQLRKSFSIITDSSATQSKIADAFVALINADATCASYLTAAKTTENANNGISLTAKAQAYSKLNGLEQVSFEVTVDSAFSLATRIDELGYVRLNGAAPTVTGATSTTPTPGLGTYANIAELELSAKGNDGVSNFTKFPVPDASFEVLAVSGAEYDVYIIDHFDQHASANLNGQIESPLQTIIAIPDGANTANVDAILGAYLVTCPVGNPL